MTTMLLRTTTSLVVVAVVLALAAAHAIAQPARTQVEGGPTAAADAAGWSEIGFADGAAPTVLIATDADFADALTSGAVQGLLEAPLLLTNGTSLSPETAAEINRLGADEAIIFGGPMAVSDVVQTQLEALGLTTERVMGPTRIETAIAAQQRFFPDTTAATLVRAFGTDTDPTQAFADSITVGVYGAAANTPVLLTETESLTDATRDAITASAIDTVTIVGGESAVSAAVQSSVDALSSRGTTEDGPTISVSRVAGTTRYDTAAQLNRLLGYQTAGDSPRVILVEGQSDDAWVGGLPAASQAGNGVSMVLANGDLLLGPTFDFLFDGDVPLICGPGVSQTACDKAFEALQGNGTADMPPAGGGADDPDAPADGDEPDGPTGTPLDDLLPIL
jgi:putative cell wall-binding protein